MCSSSCLAGAMSGVPKFHRINLLCLELVLCLLTLPLQTSNMFCHQIIEMVGSTSIDKSIIIVPTLCMSKSITLVVPILHFTLLDYSSRAHLVHYLLNLTNKTKGTVLHG